METTEKSLTEKSAIEIDLKELFFVIWGRIITVVLVGLLCAIGAYLYTQYFVTPQYRSTTSLYVMNQEDQLTNSEMNISTSLVADFKTLITSRTVLEQVIENVGLNISTGTLAGKISVSNPSSTHFLEITVGDADAYTAKQIADAVAIVASEQIEIMMGVKRVTIVDSGNIAKNPGSPNLNKNVALGAAAGVFLTILIIIILYIMDDSIKTPGDVEQYLGVSVLGIIPTNSFERAASEKKNKKKKKKNTASHLA